MSRHVIAVIELVDDHPFRVTDETPLENLSEIAMALEARVPWVNRATIYATVSDMVADLEVGYPVFRETPQRQAPSEPFTEEVAVAEPERVDTSIFAKAILLGYSVEPDWNNLGRWQVVYPDACPDVEPEAGFATAWQAWKACDNHRMFGTVDAPVKA